MLARAIFAEARRQSPWPLSPRWWDERAMQWSMGEPGLKGRLFRLVDVLPALPDRRAVAEHLSQYLADGEPDGHVSALARMARLIGPMVARGDALFERMTVAAVLGSVRRLARRFIAGATVEQAAESILRLRARHVAFSLDLLGEQVLSEREADEYANQYLALIRGLTDAAAAWPVDPQIDQADDGTPLPRVNVSIKLSGLYSQFDPLARRRVADAVVGRLRPILRLARERGAFIHVDMEHHEVKDLTLDLFERIATDVDLADWPGLGIVIQAYLTDSPADLDRVIALARRRGTPLTVRLVKGAYWDYENVIATQRGWPLPVFPHKHQTDANFEQLTRVLLAHSDVVRPAIASHNVRSIAHAMAAAEAMGLPPRRVEFQMLYGMGEPIQAALVGLSQRVRVYAPFGPLLPGMAYLIRRLLENTSNESFLRQGFFQHAGLERLIGDPAAMPSPRVPVRENASVFVNAPDTDFAKEGARVTMQQAIERTRGRLGRTYQPIIAGGPVGGAETMLRENPAQPAEVVARVELASVAQADAAVAAAQAAQMSWGETPVRERAALLNRLADLIERNRADLAALEVFETAKQWREADADVSEAVDYCRYYGRQAVSHMAQPRRHDLPGEDNVYRYLPRGVGVVIAPWNFPLAILCGMSTAAVAAGNAVLVKPAGPAQAIAGEFVALAGAAGFPPGVFNYLPCRGSTIGEHLVRHRGVDFIAFTGSRQVGLAIYAAAAASPGRQGPKRVVCEMGGKNAIIVDADADLDDAVRGVIASAFGYNGQKCSACSRVIAVGDVHDRFVERLVEAARSLTIGPPADPENFMGPLIDRAAWQRVRQYVEAARSQGDVVLETDVSGLGDGYYVGPTIVVDVPPTAPIAQEEIFGPVLCVLRAVDFDDSIRLANGVDFALTGGVYSRSPAHVERAKLALRVGNLYINRRITGALVDRQPFGGFKYSGLGAKAGGPDYLLEFVVPQTVTENTLRHGYAPEPSAADKRPRGAKAVKAPRVFTGG